MESALKLGDMGYRVLVVEKEASVGGKMILLSKVFPTLDCASCISTPKMAATIHHPNITVRTYAEVERIRRRQDGSFSVSILQNPRFVDEAACTGCQLCEQACTVAVPDQFNADLVSRRAAYIPFPQAVPKKAVIERQGTSPCTFDCPAGIKAHGYVSLARSGEYEKAFSLVLESTPLVGSLGRACFAPCEDGCSRGSLEGPLPIRRIKRFVADTHYGSHLPPAVTPGPATGKRVAVVGSGPAGLTAAWHLRLLGHEVTVYEAGPVAGGALGLTIPNYRLPSEVVAEDVGNVTAIGVEIELNHRVSDLDELGDQGFDAVLVATGTPRSGRLGVEGEDLPQVFPALDFLEASKLGRWTDLRGKRVVVVGGGNVAIDAARSARRLGAVAVTEVCLEARAEMPAFDWEVDEALAEGVRLEDGWGIARVVGSDSVEGLELKRCTAVFDARGRFQPSYDEGARRTIACDLLVVAIGMGPDTETFAPLLDRRGNGTLAVDPDTLQSRVPSVFACGDVVDGATMITTAVGQGRRAAHMIDRYLNSQEFDPEAFDLLLPRAEAHDVLRRQKSHSRKEAVASGKELDHDPSDFHEIEASLSEAEVHYSAGRCLDCGVCSECHECVNVCPADAIRLDMRPERVEAEVAAVVVSTGFKLFPADLKPQYGFGPFKNVITGMQMDRLLAPTRPFNSVLRPGDGKVPERIAYVMCTGSRDQTVGNPLCSRICCMYSIKQNQLIMGALPLADVTVFTVDVRTAGKGYDEFYVQAQAMGTTFIKGRVAEIRELDNGDLVLRYEDIENGGEIREAEFDLVVLAVGVQPNLDTRRLFGAGELRHDPYYYVEEVDEDLNPGRTSIEGVFVAGSASGAKDIPESILHAGAAVAQAAAHVEALRVRS
jgi:heterodisulfide reductase subunit A-like polyferredoxin